MPMNFTRAAALGLSLTFAACATSDHDITDPNVDPRDLTAQEQLVVGAGQQFGLDLLRQLTATFPADNLMISPLSVSLALGMAMNGAEGTTYDEMRRTLGFGELTREEVGAAYRGLLDQLRVRDRRVQFTIANSIWYERRFAVEPDFLTTAKTQFGAEVRPLDFSASSAPGTINDWVSGATGGRIKDLIDRIDPLDVMFLVNAMYFKAPWSAPFEKQVTRAGEFERADGSVVSAQLMSQDGSFPNHDGSDAALVELFYGDSAYSMVLALPKSGTVDALVQSLTVAKWEQWLAALRPGRIMLTLPRFEYRTGDELSDELKALGMRTAFIPLQADFGRINPDADDLHVSAVVHKTFISVDEEGTEASAATSVTMSVTSMPPSYSFTRPFFYAIRERSTGTILFTGIVRDPSKS